MTRWAILIQLLLQTSFPQERAIGRDELLPFLLEDEMRAKGADYSSGELWAVHAVRDGKLVTGQNPQSSVRVADLVVEALLDSQVA